MVLYEVEFRVIFNPVLALACLITRMQLRVYTIACLPRCTQVSNRMIRKRGDVSRASVLTVTDIRCHSFTAGVLVIW